MIWFSFDKILEFRCTKNHFIDSAGVFLKVLDCSVGILMSVTFKSEADLSHDYVEQDALEDHSRVAVASQQCMEPTLVFKA